MGGTGKRRAGEDNVRLRHEAALRENRLAWYRSRLRDVGGQMRTWRARAEIAEGRLGAADQLIGRQVLQLMERDAEIDRLQRQLKADTVRTQEIPVVTAAQLTAA
jgi:hypothetical protein